MTATRENIRRKRLSVLGVAAFGLSVLVFLAYATDRPPATQDNRYDLPVLTDFSAARTGAEQIRITLADESYALENKDNGWVMAGSGGYPVRPDRLSQLASGLESLRWAEPRTRDPDKLNRIGLGDPREGGTGALIEIIGADGEVTTALITGRKDKNLYARLPNEVRAYRVKGELPPLYNHDAWLDLDIIDINEDAVEAVRLFDISGNELFLQRRIGGGERSFRPAPPYQDYRLVSRIAASTPALALTRLQPIGVKPAKSLSTSAIARHITQTHDGLEVDLRAYREPDGFFVTLRAIEAGEGAHRGSTINDKAEGWAFQLSEYDWNDFTPRISSIVRPPPEPAAETTTP